MSWICHTNSHNSAGVNTLLTWTLGALTLLLVLWLRIIPRLELSRAKHRSLDGHSRWARRLARLVPFYEYDAARFFSVDGAPEEVAARRRGTSELGVAGAAGEAA